MKIELCRHCKELGYCQFERDAIIAVEMVEKGQIKPIEASLEIADARIFARDIRNCPNINEVNPEIPGL